MLDDELLDTRERDGLRAEAPTLTLIGCATPIAYATWIWIGETCCDDVLRDVPRGVRR